MFRDFFRGRYGLDTLGITLLFVSIILSRFNLIWIIGAALFLCVIFRIMSNDINKRLQEQQKFNALLQKLSKAFSREIIMLRRLFIWLQNKYTYNKMIFQQRKQFEFFKCPKCKKVLRLPKNKGKLQVTCPVCKFEFIKKT